MLLQALITPVIQVTDVIRLIVVADQKERGSKLAGIADFDTRLDQSRREFLVFSIIDCPIPPDPVERLAAKGPAGMIQSVRGTFSQSRGRFGEHQTGTGPLCLFKARACVENQCGR